MKRLLCATIIGATMFPLAAPAAEGRLSIFPAADQTYVINQPGSHILVSDVTFNNNITGIQITASDVTLDLNGQSLDAPGGSTGIGILIDSSATNVRIMNGKIRRFGWGIAGGREVQVEDVEIAACSAGGIIVGDRSSVIDTTVTGSAFVNSSFDDIVNGDNTIRAGIAVGRDGRVEDSRVLSMGGPIFDVGTDAGILVGDRTLITGCEVKSFVTFDSPAGIYGAGNDIVIRDTSIAIVGGNSATTTGIEVQGTRLVLDGVSINELSAGGSVTGVDTSSELNADGVTITYLNSTGGGDMFGISAGNSCTISNTRISNFDGSNGASAYGVALISDGRVEDCQITDFNVPGEIKGVGLGFRGLVKDTRVSAMFSTGDSVSGIVAGDQSRVLDSELQGLSADSEAIQGIVVGKASEVLDCHLSGLTSLGDTLDGIRGTFACNFSGNSIVDCYGVGQVIGIYTGLFANQQALSDNERPSKIANNTIYNLRQIGGGELEAMLHGIQVRDRTDIIGNNIGRIDGRVGDSFAQIAGIQVYSNQSNIVSNTITDIDGQTNAKAYGIGVERSFEVSDFIFNGIVIKDNIVRDIPTENISRIGINVAAPNVTIEGNTLQGTSTGINVTEDGAQILENRFNTMGTALRLLGDNCYFAGNIRTGVIALVDDQGSGNVSGTVPYANGGN